MEENGRNLGGKDGPSLFKRCFGIQDHTSLHLVCFFLWRKCLLFLFLSLSFSIRRRRDEVKREIGLS
jgi:hypothetical protein